MSEEKQMFSSAVITLSDKGAAGKREDTSGQSLLATLEREGFDNRYYVILPDEHHEIVATLKECVDSKKIDLIVTTGGTGLSERDCTPEATKEVLDKEVPGMAEAMRAESYKKTVHAVISRGVTGIRKKSLIVNLPGSKRAAEENLAVILPALPHALAKLKGDPSDCGSG